MLTDIALIILAYLAGSLSAAIIVCKLLGLPDPRSAGSKNPGATNVLRYGGKRAAAITLVGDMVKGLLPVLLAKALGVSPAVLGATALAAFLGHLYPVFFGFQGGKGVATAFGVLVGMHWPLGLALVATWLVMALISRISSLSALTAATLAPLYTWWLTGELVLTGVTVVLAVMLIWRHRSNIQRLLAGTEGHIGHKD